MSHQSTRMSPLTALFLGVFGVGAVAIASVTSTVIYGLSIVDGKASTLIGLAENTVTSLPEIIESLPPVLADVFHDRRAPEYMDSVEVQVRFVSDTDSQTVRPVLTVTNKGDQVVSMLAVRVAAFGEAKVPLRDWTAMVATPLAIEDDVPGPLFPGKTRHMVLSRSHNLYGELSDDNGAAVEVSEIRVWTPDEPAKPL